MASAATLIIAQTALSGALFRPDPRPCSRDEIESMFALLSSATTECSPPNVQRCKQWALSNLVPSSARIPPFCKYLVALVDSFGAPGSGNGNGKVRGTSPMPDRKGGREPSVKRKRLHVLYILNDILYHVKFRTRDESFAQKLEPTLPGLVRSASSFQKCPKHIAKIHDLIDLWEEQGYFSASFIAQLRAAVDESPLPGDASQKDAQSLNPANSISKAAKTAPYVIPSVHGDPSIPWYDLPAGNWLPVLEPNSTRPMNPTMIKPLVLAPGPADKTLVDAVKKLLVDVEKIYSKDVNLDEPPADIDQMGEFIERDGIEGGIAGGDTYYGWSRAFCKKMQARRRGGPLDDGDHDRGRTRSSGSYSRSKSPAPPRHRSGSDASSRSPDRPAFKRPRLSHSPQGRYRDRSRTRSRSDSRSRSRGPGLRKSRRSHSPSRSRSRSRSKSRSRSRGFQPKSPSYGRSRSSSRSRSRTRSARGYSSPPSMPVVGLPPRPPNTVFVPLPNPPPPHPNFHQPHIPYPIPQMPHQPNFAGFPVPPPPPPNFGQWPPPPPPQAVGQQQNYYPGANPPTTYVGGWAAPPMPPLPPPPPQDQQYSNGFHPGQRGGSNYRGQSGGRGGGYGRGGGNRW
ncbi:hypothetical protein B0T22DRAFT_223561 [Podospora appendiculata]|uniref:CID domain-containing protein n=1 Tax=Podospora appendiculata TaxID=314037 RepID=A0AAE1CAK2_9PEZI|nr:hypothetical protein B0T22DRAFT_223561 [Podospora appendiculata]